MIQIGRESISRPLGSSLQSGHSICQLSLAGRKDEILKRNKCLQMKGVLNSIYMWMLRRGDNVPNTCVKLVSFSCPLLLSHCLLSLAFACQRNSKHHSYISIWLFFKFNGNRNTMTKMWLKVIVIIFATPQLEKYPD